MQKNFNNFSASSHFYYFYRIVFKLYLYVFALFSTNLCFHACQFIHFSFQTMVKYCDHTPNADHCHHRSKSDPDQMPLTDQSDCDSDTDVEKVKTVFRKSHTGQHDRKQ